MADDKDKKNNSQNSGQNGFKHEGASVNSRNDFHHFSDTVDNSLTKGQTINIVFPSKKETSFTQTVSTMSAKDKNDNK